MTSVCRSLWTNSSRMRAMVRFLSYVYFWWAARWQFMNWNCCPRRVASILIAPLFPKILHRPALSFSFLSTSKLSFSWRLMRMAEWRPPIVWQATTQCWLKTYESIPSHSVLASQQKDRQRVRSHSWVPNRMMSGNGLKLDDSRSSTSELTGGREPKRFHVTATITIFYWWVFKGYFECYYYDFIIINRNKRNSHLLRSLLWKTKSYTVIVSIKHKLN